MGEAILDEKQKLQALLDASGPQVFSAAEFCARNNVSRSLWFKLLKQGRAPRLMRFGNVTKITREAELDWRARMEKESASEARR
jgi:hypothetical protein